MRLNQKPLLSQTNVFFMFYLDFSKINRIVKDLLIKNILILPLEKGH